MIVPIDSVHLNIYIILASEFDDGGHYKAIEAPRPHGGGFPAG
jgi:hypothetical protein